MAYRPLPAARGIPVRVNLYSDTQTLPTPGMKAAMMEAALGDEQMGTDPTVIALCERMAALMGKQAAVFLPSGTMCNQIAIATHCRPGDEILAHESAHILSSEGGGAAALSGVQITGLQGTGGQFTPDTLAEAIRVKSRHAPPQVLMEVEQTANFAGGTVWSLDRLNAVADMAHENGMRTHMDGARLMNAVVAAGVSAAEMAAGYDSVWLDFTKGLGAPLGAVLCGDAAFIDVAWRWKQRMGGALRQGGLSAAACLYALDHNIDRLAEDHENAKLLARELAQLPTLRVEAPETNLVYIDTTESGMDAQGLAQRVRGAGVLISVMGKHRARACTHLDVTRDHVLEAAQAIRSVMT
jgi:threonine aldolase